MTVQHTTASDLIVTLIDAADNNTVLNKVVANNAVLMSTEPKQRSSEAKEQSTSKQAVVTDTVAKAWSEVISL